MSPRELRTLDGSTPAGYLAALGLTAMVDGARLVFDHDGVPVLESDLGDDVLATTVAEGIEHLTAPDHSPLPEKMRSTTPNWSELATLSLESWQSPVADSLLRSFDIGSVKPGGAPPLDPKVISGTLVLISGKSYLRKSAGELWPAATRRQDPEQVRADQREALRGDIARILAGADAAVSTGSMALRFTTSEASPRLRRGAETAEIVPVVEGLALAGLARLLPAQTGWDGRRGFTWALHDVPLSARAMVDIHEARSAPRHWPRFTAAVCAIGGGTKASEFVDIHRVEDP